MPVTAKLSRAFYDKLGDDVANELVGLLNIMDSTYLSELRTLNGSNFALFDAKVEQRFAESDARLEKRFAEWDRRFAEHDARWERRIATFEMAVDKRFNEQDAKMEAGFSRQHQSLLRWMFALSLGLIALFIQSARN